MPIPTMASQTPRLVDSRQSEMRQTIHNVSATDGSICLAGTFQNVTIGNNQQTTIKEKINSCRNALFVSHPDLDRDALVGAKGRRTEGTCEWILQNPYFKSWLACEFPVLRISGGPGKGKTVLSIFLTEQVQQLCQHTGDRLLFFFCRFHDDRYNDPRSVLRSLAYQILEFSHDYAQVNEVLKYFEHEEKKKDVLSNFEGLWKIFETLLSQTGLPTIWCIIDGIDECKSSETLARRLYEYCGRDKQFNDEAKFQLLILGRDVDGSNASHIIKLDADQKTPVRSDVESFITSSLEELPKIPRFAQIREDVTNILITKAEGTFLWVSFVIAELRRKKTCLEIMDTVESFPKGLDPTFARMLRGIDTKYRQASACVIMWVMFARRPLTLAEVADATAETVRGRDSEADAEATADIIQILGTFPRDARR